MKTIRSNDEIKERVLQVEDKLKYLSSLIEEILERPYLKRSPEMSLFLDVENKVYRAILNELKWMLNE